MKTRLLSRVKSKPTLTIFHLIYVYITLSIFGCRPQAAAALETNFCCRLFVFVSPICEPFVTISYVAQKQHHHCIALALLNIAQNCSVFPVVLAQHSQLYLLSILHSLHCSAFSAPQSIISVGQHYRKFSLYLGMNIIIKFFLCFTLYNMQLCFAKKILI